jgi:beta-fructofuranosidase
MRRELHRSGCTPPPTSRAWEFAGILAAHPRHQEGAVDTGEMWECPQVIYPDGQAVILVGAWTRQDGTMRVYSVTGSSDGASSGALTISPFDEGPDFYAASALRDSPEGTLIWGWATEARDCSWCIEDGWSGMLTLPRVVRPIRRAASL